MKDEFIRKYPTATSQDVVKFSWLNTHISRNGELPVGTVFQIPLIGSSENLSIEKSTAMVSGGTYQSLSGDTFIR